MEKHMKIATLSEEGAAKLQALEAEMGVHIMALEPEKTLAALSDEQLGRVKTLEQELGVVLIVYED